MPDKEPQYKKIKNLFLRQSYLDSWEDYERSLRNSSFLRWDYIILTASNEDQADSYLAQIQYRIDNQLLPEGTHYAVLPDPNGKRVGSGGATLNVLKYIAETNNDNSADHFGDKRILVIHSGGDSKRVPQYSACGKLFSPIPRELPNGRPSTLFDEVIIGMSGVPSRIRGGMLVLSGDVLLLFNPLQIDFQFQGAAAISIKKPVSVGKNHGVFLNDGFDNVDRFLHKQTEGRLQKLGAVNDHGNVDLDTGAIIMDGSMLNALFSLISINNKVDEEKFAEYVNEKTRLSFYGDFLFPLAKQSSLEDYYIQEPEGGFCEELKRCRTNVWEVLHEFSMKLLCLSPAEFIHFGTTKELLHLMTKEVENYEFLDWKKSVCSNVDITEFAANNSYVSETAKIGEGAYLEDCCIMGQAKIGKNTILSGVTVTDLQIPCDIVLHGIPLKNGKYTVRIYGTLDNPKGTYKDNTSFLMNDLQTWMEQNQIDSGDIWNDEEPYLWLAKLYPVCDTMEDAVKEALLIYKMSEGTVSNEELKKFLRRERMSLYSTFNAADVRAIISRKQKLEDRIVVDKFLKAIDKRTCYADALITFGITGLSPERYDFLMETAKQSVFSKKIRIYYYISRYMKEHALKFSNHGYDKAEGLCFSTIQDAIYENTVKNINNVESFRIAKEQVDIKLPVRVNWGGGWTDTPPHCIENGGVVINAAIKLNGNLPVQVTVRKLEKYRIEFESQDIGVFGVVTKAKEIQDCHNPFDSFALHKAALIASGIVPIKEECDLQKILQGIGGGVYLSTQVIGVPKGSGLGTSSILAGACIKGIHEFLGVKLSEDDLYKKVLCMEQIMSTGGGWQDQVGGLTAGIKFITAKPGIHQNLKVEKVLLAEKTLQELQERFMLIYTGQRRLARNLLRKVVGSYVGGKKEALTALHEMQRVAALMKFELEQGDIDAFAKLLNRHWELSKQLDKGSTNTCIDQIFMVCEDLIDGRFVAGAGGGGFIQVILKKGITKEMVRERLLDIFQDSGVDIWDCEII